MEKKNVYLRLAKQDQDLGEILKCICYIMRFRRIKFSQLAKLSLLSFMKGELKNLSLCFDRNIGIIMCDMGYDFHSSDNYCDYYNNIRAEKILKRLTPSYELGVNTYNRLLPITLKDGDIVELVDNNVSFVLSGGYFRTVCGTTKYNYTVKELNTKNIKQIFRELDNRKYYSIYKFN